MSHCTCETCICFMLKVFINFMFVWLSLLKGVVGGCVLFTCHGQFLSHPNVVTHPKLSFSRGGKGTVQLDINPLSGLLWKQTKAWYQNGRCPTWRVARAVTSKQIEQLPRTSIGFEREKGWGAPVKSFVEQFSVLWQCIYLLKLHSFSSSFVWHVFEVLFFLALFNLGSFMFGKRRRNVRAYRVPRYIYRLWVGIGECKYPTETDICIGLSDNGVLQNLLFSWGNTIMIPWV